MIESDRRAWLTVAVITLGAFVVVVNLSILSPLLRPIAQEFGVTEAKAGQLGTIASITGAVAALLLAPLMDRVSTRSWYLWQTLILIVITAASALAPTFAVLLLVRAGSNISLLMAKGLTTCADIFADEQRRNRAIGIVVSAATAGVIGGLPVIALIEDSVGWRWAIASLLAPLLLVLAGLRLLPATAHTRAATGARFTDGYRLVLGNGRARVLLFTGMVLGFTYIGWLTYLGAHVEVDYGGSARVLSLVFLVAGVGELIANNLIPAALRRWNATALYVAGGIGYTAALAAGGLGTQWVLTIFVTSTVISICSAAQYIVVNILLMDAIPEARGTAISLGTAALGIGAAAGVAAAGFTLSLMDDYGAVFRMLALVVPLGIAAVIWSARVHPLAGSIGSEAAS